MTNVMRTATLMDEPSEQLLARYQAGDETAAEEMFRRYVSRLTVFARTRLAPRIAQRVDPDDVVHSAYRSFFVRARNGQFSLRRSGDLWRLLVGITLNKVRHQVARETADKRSIDREVSDVFTSEQISRSPRPEEALALADELETVMSALSPVKRRILELRLLDYSLAEIATDIGRSERTVRRMLAELQGYLERKLLGNAVDCRARHRLMRTHGELPDEAHETAAAAIPSALLATNFPSNLPQFEYRDFVLEAHLGSGGIGKVYRAWWKDQKKCVAIKMLRKRWWRQPGIDKSLFHEAEILVQLHHAHIVGMHGIGWTPQGGAFLVIDLMEGGDLASLREPPLPSKAIEWIADAAAGLSFAHCQGIIHRDLKPSNLLLDCLGRVRVADFGLALAKSGETRRDECLVGTAAYMAPEQLFGDAHHVGPAADVYSLGAVFYALVAGHPPFDGNSLEQVIEQRVRKLQPTRLRAVHPALPEKIEAIVNRCLAADPKERFPSMDELIAALAMIRTASAGA